MTRFSKVSKLCRPKITFPKNYLEKLKSIDKNVKFVPKIKNAGNFYFYRVTCNVREFPNEAGISFAQFDGK